MKHFLLSKTLWFNALAIGAIVLQAVTGAYVTDVQTQAIVMALVNMILRFTTSKGIKIGAQ